jgi:hypothetical protein
MLILVKADYATVTGPFVEVALTTSYKQWEK